MSLEAVKKNLKMEMKSGVHLAIISGMARLLDAQKNTVIKDDEMGIVITFANGRNEQHEQIYWIGKGIEGKEKYFTKMCVDAGIDMSKTPLAKKDAIGRRLWIAIREVYTLVNGGEEVKKDITGAEVIEHFVFNTSPCFDPEKKPIFKGDPANNDGMAMDDFIAYKLENQSGYDVAGGNTNDTFSLDVEEINEKEFQAILNEESAEIYKKITDENAISNILDDHKEIIKKTANKVFKDLVVKGTSKIELPSFETPIETKPKTPNPYEKLSSTQLPNFGDDISPDANF